MMMVAGGLLAMASCSDFSDYNTVPVANEPSADKTLWENISGSANLSDFASVLQRVGYDKVLDAAHTYTVWAPVNGSFNMDSLKNVSDDKVEKEFVKNVIADYAHKESDLNDTTIYMLNKKLLKFNNKSTGTLSFDARQVLPNTDNPSIYNYPSVNGLLYNVASPAAFRFNAYEIISEQAGVASNVMSYIKKYEKVTLDEANSVKGEIRDGVQHYDDSVMVTSNSFTERTLRAQLDNEDSLYTILLPNDKAWEEAYSTISKYYKYIPQLAYQDLGSTAMGTTKGGSVSGTPVKPTNATIMAATVGSATVTMSAAPADAEIEETGAYWTDSIAKRYITNNLVFSETNKKYNGKLAAGLPFAENDSIYSTTGNKLSNPSALVDATESTVKLSNGHARILNKFPFLPEETYLPEIKTRIVGRCVTATGKSYTNVTVLNVPKEICTLDEGETELRYVKTDLESTANYAPELDFYLPGVRSATYDIYAVIVPACVEDPTLEEADRKPYALRFDINYTDANNKQIAGRFDGEQVRTTLAEIRKVPTFFVAQNKVDTVKLGRMTFPVCYTYTSAMPNIKVMHVLTIFTASNKKLYEQQLRVANIIMKPVFEDEENATKED